MTAPSAVGVLRALRDDYAKYIPQFYAGNRKLMKQRLDEADAALASLEAAEGWRPIDSAPKDGTEFDVWCPENCLPKNGYRITRCWWCQVDQRFRTYGDNRMTWARQPTHWRAEPAPPAAASDGEGGAC